MTATSAGADTPGASLAATPAASVPPLIERLVSQHGAVWVDTRSIDAFLATPGDRVLFFAGDPVRFPECLDVAVVLPELQLAFPGRFAVGVVRREEEDALARRFGSQRWPALVFLRDGRYVTTIAGMLDWDVYLERIAQALAMPTSRAPMIGIAVVAEGGSTSCR
ncbi:MAG: hydrogenase [Pseudomonadota bacterium]|jgi:hydrogenase-1 operon protein HyaE